MNGLNEKEIAALEHEAVQAAYDQKISKFQLEAVRRFCQKLYKALNDKLAKAEVDVIELPPEEIDRMIRELNRPGMIRLASPEEMKVTITPRWIPVEEALPEAFVTVLVSIETVNGYGDPASCQSIGRYLPVENLWEDFAAPNRQLRHGENVSHWMPMPPAPEVNA